MSPRIASNYDSLDDYHQDLALAAWLTAHLPDWQGPGSTTGNGGIQTGTSTPTEGAAIHRIDEGGNTAARLVTQAHQFIAHIDKIKTLIAEANPLRHAIEPLRQQHQAHLEQLATTTGFCVADDKECDGTTPYLTLYNGLCGSCRKAFERFPKTSNPDNDREAFITSRRREQRRVAGRR